MRSTVATSALWFLPLIVFVVIACVIAQHIDRERPTASDRFVVSTLETDSDGVNRIYFGDIYYGTHPDH